MALRKFLILRRPRSGRLEGRAMPIQRFRRFPHTLFRRNDNERRIVIPVSGKPLKSRSVSWRPDTPVGSPCYL